METEALYPGLEICIKTWFNFFYNLLYYLLNNKDPILTKLTTLSFGILARKRFK